MVVYYSPAYVYLIHLGRGLLAACFLIFTVVPLYALWHVPKMSMRVRSIRVPEQPMGIENPSGVERPVELSVRSINPLVRQKAKLDQDDEDED